MPPRDLLALTLIRPWSDAIVRGPKRVENRSWAPGRRMLGAHIAVHAGTKYDAEAFVDLHERRIGGFVPPLSSESPAGIVGVARILGWLDTSGARPRVHAPEVAPAGVDHAELVRRLWLLEEDPWWAGPCGWLLDEVTPIEPVPCRGALGLWRVPEDVAALVRERWKHARLSAQGGAHA